MKWSIWLLAIMVMISGCEKNKNKESETSIPYRVMWMGSYAVVVACDSVTGNLVYRIYGDAMVVVKDGCEKEVVHVSDNH